MWVPAAALDGAGDVLGGGDDALAAAAFDEVDAGFDLRAHGAGREFTRREILARLADGDASRAIADRACPKRMAACSTEVTMISFCAPRSRARRLEARSLSMTPSTPTSRSPCQATGIPPPPHAITTTPASDQAAIASSSRIAIGCGEATTRRKRPGSTSRRSQCGPLLPDARDLARGCKTRRWACWGGRNRDRPASTSTCVITVATLRRMPSRRNIRRPGAGSCSPCRPANRRRRYRAAAAARAARLLPRGSGCCRSAGRCRA